jgi:hypothetical protein
MVCSDRILAVPLNRKLSEFHSKLFRGREKNAQNSVPWNKNWSKLLEFRSEPFHVREKCSEFSTLEQKKKQTLGIPFLTIPRKRKQLGILFRGTNIEANFRNFVLRHFAEENTLSILCKIFWLFCKTYFLRLIPFRFELRNWLFPGPQNAPKWALSSAV